MFSLRVTLVFLLATLIFTLAQPTTNPSAAPVATTQEPELYNVAEVVEYLSKPVSDEGYEQTLQLYRNEDGVEKVVFEHIRKDAVSAKRILVTRTYFDFFNKTKITALNFTSTNTANGALVSIGAGGVGKDFVTLHFLVEPNNGLDYDISIYCK